MGLVFSPPFPKFTAAPNWSIPSFPNAKSTCRALAAPHTSFSPAMDGQRCFQGCSSIPALLPELCLLLVPGLTLTSSGAGNSGILPPNSRLFPPVGGNLHSCYQISESKLRHFFPVVLHLHICTQTQMHDFLSFVGVGDVGLNQIPLLGWTQGPWGSVLSPRAPKGW